MVEVVNSISSSWCEILRLGNGLRIGFIEGNKFNVNALIQSYK